MARPKKPKQPPQPKYRVVGEETKDGKEIRQLIKGLLKTVAAFKELAPAKIAIAWMIRIKEDRDGRVVLGKMKKASELDRELHGFDAVLILNEDHWRILEPEQRLALVDHELCHLRPVIDPKTLEQAADAHSRKKWRIAKHDLEEFRAVVERHGLYKSDIAAFAKAIKDTKALPLFPVDSPRPTLVPSTAAAAVNSHAKGNGADHPAPKAVTVSTPTPAPAAKRAPANA